MMTQMLRFAAVFAAGCALAGAAFGDPYKVKDLVVDKVASTAAEATQQGNAEARLLGAQRLIDRLTLPEDLAAASEPIDVNHVGTRLYRNHEIQEQVKTFPASGGYRVTSVVTWNFDPAGVRNYLNARGVPYVDTQAAKALLVPAVAGGVDPDAWGAHWSQVSAQGARTPRSDTTVLTPYIASVETWTRRPAWIDVQAEISSAAAVHAVVVEAFSQGGGTYVRIIDLRTGAANTSERVVGPFADLAAAQRGAIAEMERAWKAQSIVRTSGSTDVALTATFRDIGEWVKIRKGLEGSRLVQKLNIESLSTAGADLRLAYAGRPEQLVADLRSRGVDLRGTDDGWVLQVVAAQ
jgi:hypothetical protein